MLACVLVVNTTLGVTLGAARLAERIELRALGLIDGVDCHSDATGAASGTHDTGKPHHHGTLCDCCLNGCAGSAPATLADDRGAVSRPLRAANAATRVAQSAATLRSYLSERTRDPRSPPMAA